ncbi:hypothetical protein SUDANB140_03425 [Streptomyces sp. enrichment culture]
MTGRATGYAAATVLETVSLLKGPRTVEEYVMSARKTPVLALAAVALGLALTACGGNDGTGDDAAPATPAATATATAQSPAPADTAAAGTGSTAPDTAAPEQGTQDTADAAKCTDRIDYAGDPRPNAEINSIGEETGTCPEPQPDGTPSGTPKESGVKCTDQVNYAGDPRPNAEINSIGEETGTCPPVQGE